MPHRVRVAPDGRAAPRLGPPRCAGSICGTRVRLLTTALHRDKVQRCLLPPRAARHNTPHRCASPSAPCRATLTSTAPGRAPDQLAHVVIPLHPRLKPHARMLHHFRFLKPLLARDVDGMSALHYFDAAVQVARNAAREMTEAEFAEGMAAAEQITQWYVALS